MKADVKLQQREEQVTSKEAVDSAFLATSFAFAYLEVKKALFLQQTQDTRQILHPAMLEKYLAK